MGLFGDYADNGANEELYDEDGNFDGGGDGDYDDFESIQRDMNAVLEVVNVKTGVCENEGSDHLHDPYFVLECEIDEVKSQGEHTPIDYNEAATRPPREPGDKVCYFQWLPMPEIPPEKWSKSDRFNVRDVKACVASIYGVDEAIMDLESVDKTAEGAGQRVEGMLVGVDATIDEADDGRFCNLEFYNVDADGNPEAPLSPEETREVMEQA